MKEYETIRKTLTEMLEELEGRLEKISADVRHSEVPLEKDFAELATQNENNEVLDQLGNAAKTEIALIRQAIGRIDKGEYGICQACGEDINPQRLQALPYTRFCIRCASKVEK